MLQFTRECEFITDICEWFADICNCISDICNFIWYSWKFVTDIWNKMHQFHLLKISVIKFQISVIYCRHLQMWIKCEKRLAIRYRQSCFRDREYCACGWQRQTVNSDTPQRSPRHRQLTGPRFMSGRTVAMDCFRWFLTALDRYRCVYGEQI